MRSRKRLFGLVLFIALGVLLFMLLNREGTHHWRIPMNDFVHHLEADRVRHVTVGEQDLYGEFSSPQPVGRNRTPRTHFRVWLPQGASADWALMEWLLRHNVRIDVDKVGDAGERLAALIPWVLVFVLLWFAVFRNLRNAPTIDPNAPRPVYLVPAPTGSGGSSTMPPPPLPTGAAQQPAPVIPAPGGDN